MTLTSRSNAHALRFVALVTVALAAPGCGAGAVQPASKSAPAEAPVASPRSDDKAAPEAAPAPAPAGASYGRVQEQSLPSSSARDEGERLDDIEALSGQLDRTLRLSTPDCALAPSLRDRICDLSQRICDIAARSNENEIKDRCTDSRTRCNRATTSVRSACPE